MTVWEVEGGASSNPVGQSGTPREFMGFVPNVDDAGKNLYIKNKMNTKHQSHDSSRGCKSPDDFEVHDLTM